jgi:hypothetical protein
MRSKNKLIKTAAIPRPARPIFKSLWENFSDVSSGFFIFNRLISSCRSALAPAGKGKAASIVEKIQGPMWVSLRPKIYSTLG